MQKGTQMPKHSNSGGGVKARPQSAVNPFPKKLNVGGMRSAAKGQDDSKNWSIASQHEKMRSEAHANNADHSNLPLKGVPGGDNLKGGK